MVNKLTLTILVSIILTIILISLVNVGVSLFLDKPEYENYCEDSLTKIRLNPDSTDEERLAYDEEQEACRNEYQKARKPYNQKRYYIFAGLGSRKHDSINRTCNRWYFSYSRNCYEF